MKLDDEFRPVDVTFSSKENSLLFLRSLFARSYDTITGRRKEEILLCFDVHEDRSYLSASEPTKIMRCFETHETPLLCKVRQKWKTRAHVEIIHSQPCCLNQSPRPLLTASGKLLRVSLLMLFWGPSPLFSPQKWIQCDFFKLSGGQAHTHRNNKINHASLSTFVWKVISLLWIGGDGSGGKLGNVLLCSSDDEQTPLCGATDKCLFVCIYEWYLRDIGHRAIWEAVAGRQKESVFISCSTYWRHMRENTEYVRVRFIAPRHGDDNWTKGLRGHSDSKNMYLPWKRAFTRFSRRTRVRVVSRTHAKWLGRPKHLCHAPKNHFRLQKYFEALCLPPEVTPHETVAFLLFMWKVSPMKCKLKLSYVVFFCVAHIQQFWTDHCEHCIYDNSNCLVTEFVFVGQLGQMNCGSDASLVVPFTSGLFLWGVLLFWMKQMNFKWVLAEQISSFVSFSA